MQTFIGIGMVAISVALLLYIRKIEKDMKKALVHKEVLNRSFVKFYEESKDWNDFLYNCRTVEITYEACIEDTTNKLAKEALKRDAANFYNISRDMDVLRLLYKMSISIKAKPIDKVQLANEVEKFLIRRKGSIDSKLEAHFTKILKTCRY